MESGDKAVGAIARGAAARTGSGGDGGGGVAAVEPQLGRGLFNGCTGELSIRRMMMMMVMVMVMVIITNDDGTPEPTTSIRRGSKARILLCQSSDTVGGLVRVILLGVNRGDPCEES